MIKTITGVEIRRRLYNMWQYNDLSSRATENGTNITTTDTLTKKNFAKETTRH